MRTLIIATALLATASVAQAQGLGWTTSRALTHRFDVGPSTDDAGRIGLHYDLRYEFERSRTNPQGNHFGLALSAFGFEEPTQEEDALRSVTAEAAILGRNYQTSQTPLTPEEQQYYLELLDKPSEEMTAADTAALDGLIDRATQNRRFFAYDGHYRYEHSRTSERSQHAFGAGISGEIPRVHELLSLFSVDAPSGYQAQAVRFYLGADYVVPDDSLEVSDADERFPRLRGQLAWSTLLFEDLVLRVSWNAEYLVDAPDVFENDLNHLLQAWIVLPVVTDRGGLMLKYTAGRTAPDYESTSDFIVGFTVAVQ